MISLLAQTATNHGFLPTRGSFMLDFVVVAMAGILPILFASIFLVRSRRRYELHKWIQTSLGITLLVAVVAFEIDVRFFSNWQELAAESPYFTKGSWNPVWYVLIVHLCFAIPTPLIWIYVIVQGWRKFPRPAAPSDYSRQHARWAWIATWGMVATAVTGWIFYWSAFVA